MVDRPVLTPPEQAGHARELVREYDVFSIDGIVISSGDGLLYEVSVGVLHSLDVSVGCGASYDFMIKLVTFMTMRARTLRFSCAEDTATVIH